MARPRTSAKRRTRARRRGKRGRWLPSALLILVALALGLALQALLLMGPTPVVQPDAWWVHARQAYVRLLLGGIGVAMLATMGLWIIQRNRGLSIALWAGAAAIVIPYFGRAVTIVAEVVWNHFM